MNQWQLVWKVECSKRLLRSGGTSTLAATLDLSRKANDTRIKELGLNQRDRQIMNFALDKVADGDPDGNLEAQPWKSFLALCKNWEKSGGWREHKALEANRKRPIDHLGRFTRPEVATGLGREEGAY
jgi:adenine specific DNA methylase Mod